MVAVEDEEEEVGFVTSIDSMGPGCDLDAPGCEMEDGGCEIGPGCEIDDDDRARKNSSPQETVAEAASKYEKLLQSDEDSKETLEGVCPSVGWSVCRSVGNAFT